MAVTTSPTLGSVWTTPLRTTLTTGRCAQAKMYLNRRVAIKRPWDATDIASPPGQPLENFEKIPAIVRLPILGKPEHK